jgi:hypothetical protein
VNPVEGRHGIGSGDAIVAPLDGAPASLRKVVDVAGNGEAFWFGDYAAEVARWIASQDLAIVGGEVYRRHPVAWATYLGAWTTDPDDDPCAPWSEYVRRGLAQTLAVIESGLPDRQDAPRHLRELRYFFAAADEASVAAERRHQVTPGSSVRRATAQPAAPGTRQVVMRTQRR